MSEHLSLSPEPNEDDLLDEILLAYEQAKESGSPYPSPDELIAQHVGRVVARVDLGHARAAGDRGAGLDLEAVEHRRDRPGVVLVRRDEARSGGGGEERGPGGGGGGRGLRFR